MNWEKYFSYQMYLAIALFVFTMGVVGLFSKESKDIYDYSVGLIFSIGGLIVSRYFIKWWIDIYKKHRKLPWLLIIIYPIFEFALLYLIFK